jgi:L-ascorbate metabolism protein UlaG (beta-lactamase superfamily)
VRITKYKHTTYEVNTNGKNVLIDPGIFAFGEGLLSKEYFKNVNVLLLSHLHADHFDIEVIKNIYAASRPLVISHKDVSKELGKEGIESKTLLYGESIDFDEIRILATRTAHKQDAIGFLIDDGRTKLYYVSDSFYLEDKPFADVVIVPIGNRGIVMGPNEAMQFVKEIKPKIVIPSHYETPKDKVQPIEFYNIMKGSDIEVKILSHGNVLEV